MNNAQRLVVIIALVVTGVVLAGLMLNWGTQGAYPILILYDRPWRYADFEHVDHVGIYSPYGIPPVLAILFGVVLPLCLFSVAAFLVFGRWKWESENQRNKSQADILEQSKPITVGDKASQVQVDQTLQTKENVVPDHDEEMRAKAIVIRAQGKATEPGRAAFDLVATAGLAICGGLALLLANLETPTPTKPRIDNGVRVLLKAMGESDWEVARKAREACSRIHAITGPERTELDILPVYGQQKAKDWIDCVLEHISKSIE